jgi:hypothetical protein
MTYQVGKKIPATHGRTIAVGMAIHNEATAKQPAPRPEPRRRFQRRTAESNCGHAGRAFLAKLVEHKRDWSDALAQYRATEELGAQGGDGRISASPHGSR